MRAPVSWLREYVAIPADQTGRDVAARLIRAGLEVETVEQLGAGVVGELLIGRVAQIEELTEFKKPIRFCQVDLGGSTSSGIICGARNFVEGDLVVVAVPGTVLPGGFQISARETYGRTSNGMICSEPELGLGEGQGGIIVLPAGQASPGDDARPILGVGDEVLDIAITPDRGYALSIRGIAREVATAYGVDFRDPGVALADLPAPLADRDPAKCGSDDPTGCDLFTLRTIVGFDPAATSPLWMQTRLAACGMRPVSLAVDVTNYVMLELGQPLHAFDLDKLQGPVRAARAEAGSTFETLDHVVRTLDSDDLVIRDDRGAIGLAGTMGGLLSEIDDATVNIALEAAHFNADVVARMSRRHKLSSEASRRFERGVDRDLAPYASARACALLLEFGGGHYVGMTAVETGAAVTRISMAVSEPGDIAGLRLDDSTVVAHLTAVGCEVERAGDQLTVIPPPWRPDLTDAIDLVEEVLRLHGYDELPSTLPAAPLGRGLTPGQRMRKRIGIALAARGGVEVLSYPFVGVADLDGMRLPADDKRRHSPRLANPLSDEQPYLRPSMLPGLLSAARRNAGRGIVDLSIFEIGSVFHGDVAPHTDLRPVVDRRPTDGEWSGLNELLPTQPLHLGVLLTGAAELPGWWGQGHSATWSDAIEMAVTAASACGVALLVESGVDAPFHPGRCAALRIGDDTVGHTTIGFAGELHPRVVEHFGLPERACAAWLDLDAVMAFAPQVRRAPSVITQPVAKEDLALVVPSTIPLSQVRQAIVDGAGDLLESVRLFDVYEGPQVPHGHRSLAFALRFRAPDRTLDAAETAAARKAAIDLAQSRCGATLR